MRIIAQQVFRSVEPYRIVADLRLPIEERDGLFFTKHPQQPEHSMQIGPSEFIGMGYDSPTPACNFFDFLALHFGTYEEAMDHVIDQYHNLAALPIGITLESIQGQMVEALKNDRSQFEEILALQGPLRDREDSLVGAYLYCRRIGLSPDHAWRMMYVARGSKLNHILHYVDEEDKFDDATHYLVFPYFKNYHTFALLKIHNTDGKFIRSIELNTSRFMFFGLHTVLPDVEQTRIFEKPEDALAMHSHAMDAGDFRVGFTHVSFDPNTEVIDPPLKSGVFMAGQNTDFNTLVKNRLAFENFFVGDADRKFAETIDAMPWENYAVNRVVDALNADNYNYSPRVSIMVESLRGDPHVCNRLMVYLKQCGQKVIVDRIRKHVDTQQVYSIGSLRIVETSTGYVAKKAGTNVSSHFTNFLIKIDRTLWFEESEEAYYSGRILINGQQVPFLISHTESQQPRNIVVQAHRAIHRAGLGSEGTLPTITDTTLQGKLVDIINLQTGNKPKLIGVQRLGWNSTKTRFLAPAWEIKTLGISPTSRIIHPESKTIASYFSPREYRVTQSFEGATPQARYLIALLAASFTRAFLNQQTPTISIIRSPQSLALLKAVFRPLSQVEPVELSPNRRVVLETLSAHNFSGYPIFATCPDPTVLDNFNYPVFLLSETGMPLHEPLSAEHAAHITNLSHHVLTSLLLNFIRERLQAHGLVNTDEPPSIKDLALEGKRIIEARCGIENFDLFEPELPLMQAILSRITGDKVNEFFRYDLSMATVFIRSRRIPDVKRKPLFDELVAKNPEVKLHNEHYIACPADWFMDLLAKFYGRRIVLYHQPADSGPITEAQDGSELSETS
jgi:hypothetical protein